MLVELSLDDLMRRNAVTPSATAPAAVIADAR